MFKTLKNIVEMSAITGVMVLGIVGYKDVKDFVSEPEPLFKDVTRTGKESCEMTGLKRSAINIYAHDTEGGRRLIESSGILQRDFSQPGSGTSAVITPGETGTYRASNEAIVTSAEGITRMDGGTTTIIIKAWQDAAPVATCLHEDRRRAGSEAKVTEASVILKNDLGL